MIQARRRGWGVPWIAAGEIAFSPCPPDKIQFPDAWELFNLCDLCPGGKDAHSVEPLRALPQSGAGSCDPVDVRLLDGKVCVVDKSVCRQDFVPAQERAFRYHGPRNVVPERFLSSLVSEEDPDGDTVTLVEGEELSLKVLSEFVAAGNKGGEEE